MILAVVGCPLLPYWVVPVSLALLVVALIAGAAYCDARMGPPKRREE